MRNVGLKALGLFVVIATTILSANAQAQTWTQAGMLRCRLNPSIGFVIFGHQSMECSFQPVSGPVQAYEGAINTIGLDLGVTEGGGFAWAVFGPHAHAFTGEAARRFEPDALAPTGDDGSFSGQPQFHCDLLLLPLCKVIKHVAHAKRSVLLRH